MYSNSQLPPKLEGVVSLSPGSGLLRGNESTQLQWTFTPTKQKTYEARATCLVLNPSGAAPLLLTQLTADVGGEGEEGVEEARLLGLDVGDKVTLHVKGEGTAAALAIDPPVLDLGPLKVGTKSRNVHAVFGVQCHGKLGLVVPA